MSISSNVGIGVEAPTSKLEVNGTTNFYGGDMTLSN